MEAIGQLKALIRKHTPRAVWIRLSATKDLVLDSVDSVFGPRETMIPPRRLRTIGSGDFCAIGDEFLAYFKQFGGLSPDHSVLDLGCGIGRMAIPLTRFLSSRGSYEGLDIAPGGISWCSANITSRYPNFRFQVADVFSKFYNPTSRLRASEYRLPFADSSFDFAFLTSVFTHMLPDEVKNYLVELNRVLKPEGKCLISWLVLNSESTGLMEKGKSSVDLKYPLGDCRVLSLEVPEEAIAYPEEKVLKLYEATGFVVEYPIQYGSWCGRTSFLSYQDICVAQKP